MHHLVSKDNQKNIVKMLKEANAYGSIGNLGLRKMLPAPLKLSTLSDHSTGCQIRITLEAPGQPTIVAWEGSVWYSPSYEFNDREKVLGLNPKCDFMEPVLVRFFESVQKWLDDREDVRAAQKAAQEQRAQENEQNALEFYRQMATTMVN